MDKMSRTLLWFCFTQVKEVEQINCGFIGCPTNVANDQGVTPQKLAKAEGMKDAMKELKKLTTFQDKAARGGRPKGYAEPWCVRVSLTSSPFLTLVANIQLLPLFKHFFLFACTILQLPLFSSPTCNYFFFAFTCSCFLR